MLSNKNPLSTAERNDGGRLSSVSAQPGSGGQRTVGLYVRRFLCHRGRLVSRAREECSMSGYYRDANGRGHLGQRTASQFPVSDYMIVDQLKGHGLVSVGVSM